MIVVTGGAGFIGSAIIRYLNDAGEKDILVVDEKDITDRKRNLSNKIYTDYMDKDEFLLAVKRNKLKGVKTVIHMGACSSTTVMDKDYLDRNNYLYTRDLAIWCVNTGIHFLYASSAATYGDGSLGYSDSDEATPIFKPLNLYGQSKQDFDVWAFKAGYLTKITGFKFFNVFGPNEYHKADMRSLPNKAFKEIKETGKIKLFKSYLPKYGHGEQMRDFIYIKDAVSVVMHFFNNKNISGLYNVGTGKARSWNDLAHALFLAMKLPVNIEYIEMPEVLKTRYQYFTEADTAKLRAAGYVCPFSSLEDSIADYTAYLEGESIL
jgi:ADP-L-glycero-D-manno-heptose 6-epimerase